MIRDPRSEAEKARADLARNAELGMAVPESPLEQEPSVTPQTFADTTERARDQAAQRGVGAGGFDPERDDGDSTGTGTIPPSGRIPVYPDEGEGEGGPNEVRPNEVRPQADEDVLSRAKE